jgi:hypothetical protein
MKINNFFKQKKVVLTLAIILGIIGVGVYIGLTINRQSSSTINNCQAIQQNTDYFVISVSLEGKKSEATSLAEIRQMRQDILKLDTNARVSWAMNNDYVFYEDNRPQLELIREFVDKYGDEVSLFYGFPNNKEDEHSWQAKVDEWIRMYSYNSFPKDYDGQATAKALFEKLPDKYRPKSVTSYLINPKQSEYLRTAYGINVAMANTATQYKVDQLSAVGSPLMPYYSHKNNSLVPAQEYSSKESTLMLNTMTIDPIGSRYLEGESRWTIHPADPLTNGESQIYIISEYLNNPYKSQNTVNYLSLIIEPNWVLRNKEIGNAWQNMVSYFENLHKFQVLGVKGFSELYDCTTSKIGYNPTFTMRFSGSGYTRANHNSDSNLDYLWTETKTERIILQKDNTSAYWKIIDFTDYNTQIPIMPFTTIGEDVSFISKREYKLKPNGEISLDDINRINKRLQGIGFWEKVKAE